MAKFSVGFVVGADALGSVLLTLSKAGIENPTVEIAGGPEDVPKAYTPPKAATDAPRAFARHGYRRQTKRRYRQNIGGQRRVVLNALAQGGNLTWAELDRISAVHGYAAHSISPLVARLIGLKEIIRVSRGVYGLTAYGASQQASFKAKDEQEATA
jgi:hypothetical protein